MIAEAIDTIWTLGVALLIWVAVFAALCTPVVLLTGWALWLLLSRTLSALRAPRSEPES